MVLKISSNSAGLRGVLRTAESDSVVSYILCHLIPRCPAQRGFRLCAGCCTKLYCLLCNLTPGCPTHRRATDKIYILINKSHKNMVLKSFLSKDGYPVVCDQVSYLRSNISTKSK